MSEDEQKAAILTGGSQGIVAGYRDQGWAVVANALTTKPCNDPAVLTIRRYRRARDRRPDHHRGTSPVRARRYPVNNAGVNVSKPFTDYTAEDYVLVVGVNLAGLFWLTQRAVAETLKQGGGHVMNISATIGEVADSHAPGAPHSAVVAG